MKDWGGAVMEEFSDSNWQTKPSKGATMSNLQQLMKELSEIKQHNPGGLPVLVSKLRDIVEELARREIAKDHPAV